MAATTAQKLKLVTDAQVVCERLKSVMSDAKEVCDNNMAQGFDWGAVGNSIAVTGTEITGTQMSNGIGALLELIGNFKTAQGGNIEFMCRPLAPE